jgi:hypothetical protein
MAGKRTGLVIGNNYPDSKQELNFAVADALSMKEVLLNKDIYECSAGRFRRDPEIFFSNLGFRLSREL